MPHFPREPLPSLASLTGIPRELAGTQPPKADKPSMPPLPKKEGKKGKSIHSRVSPRSFNFSPDKVVADLIGKEVDTDEYTGGLVLRKR